MTKIADLITGGLLSKQQERIKQLEEEIKLKEGQVEGWQQLLRSVMPIVKARAGDILQQTWKELMSDEQHFTTCEMPEELRRHFKSKEL